jgi:hypothetical protein
MGDVSAWLSGWTASSPFVAVSNGDGSFRFEDVPRGSYTLHVYGASQPITRAVTVDAPTIEVTFNPARRLP